MTAQVELMYSRNPVVTGRRGECLVRVRIGAGMYSRNLVRTGRRGWCMARARVGAGIYSRNP